MASPITNLDLSQSLLLRGLSLPNKMAMVYAQDYGYNVLTQLTSKLAPSISPIIHIISCTSIDVSLRPLACLNVSTTKSNSFFNGSGPLARPPNTLSLAPAGRTLLKSNVGISPSHKEDKSFLKALAQPSLLSSTNITSSQYFSSAGTSGSLEIS